MTFAEVILPLALPNTLTYRIPRDWQEHMRVGIRVVVQLGKNKLYTGIVVSLSEKAPTHYEAKYIEHILDEQPIVLPKQLELWRWIAAYYNCTMGEVMNAALPGGLKLSSETTFVLHEDWEQAEHLTEQAQILVGVLREKEEMTVNEISALLQLKVVQPLLRKLIEKKVIIAREELREKFKPRLVDFLHLAPELRDDAVLRGVFEELERKNATKQTDVLMTFLVESGYDHGHAHAVKRLALQQQTGAPASLIQTMVNRGIFTLETREVGRIQPGAGADEAPRVLSAAQQQAFEEIKAAFEEKDIALLHGVTSSGKTEVYVSLIEAQLKQGKQVLFLLPEIALTTQIIGRLRKFFGARVGVYHSGYNDAERTEVWNKVLSDLPGEYDIVLGARSSVFLPFTRLGLIIVDEEHEHSFKQYDPAPRYHARDTAIVLAKMFDAKVLLGSATPSIESYFNAEQKRYGFIELKERFGGLELPEIIVSDLRAATKAKALQGSFSEMLVEHMSKAIAAGEQVILFQNRRGYSPIWQCHTCGWVPMCTRCDVSLTYHKAPHRLKCHYCGYHSDPPLTCGACGSSELRMLGFGTEKIEEEISQLFPEIRVQRMDLDTTRSKHGYQNIINDFEAGNIQVLVGTQMVTKGLDFDNVSLVGILNADKMMSYPDFRSMERSFQTMMQVSGRAGRKGKRGKVVIQTFQPTHWLFELVRNGDYKQLYQHEMTARKHFGYPPIVRLIRVTFKHKEDNVVQAAVARWTQQIKPELGHHLLGPERPTIPRINNYYLWEFLIKLEKNHDLQKRKQTIGDSLRLLLAEQGFKSVRVSVDVDPV